jgi:formylglycine-generating enzyme required for sulfatase activity
MKVLTILVALLVSITSVSAQAKKQPAKQKKTATAKPAKPAPNKVTPKSDAYLLVSTTAKGTLFLDGKANGTVSPKTPLKVNLPAMGSFKVKLVSAESPKDVIEQVVKVTVKGQTLVDLDLASVIKTRKDKEAEAERKKPFISKLAGKLIMVEGGEFNMGCTAEQTEFCEPAEKPSHRVKLGNYYMGEAEVTQAQWIAVMGDNPSKFSDCKECPVDNVSLDDINAFIKELNRREGTDKYRLPTEAEWEYAAKGGNKPHGFMYSGGKELNEAVWFKDNSALKTHPVKTKTANNLGFYDMNGNVDEWTADNYGSYPSDYIENPKVETGDKYYVVRGGSWGDLPADCRVTVRDQEERKARFDTFGFRLVRNY